MFGESALQLNGSLFSLRSNVLFYKLCLADWTDYDAARAAYQVALRGVLRRVSSLPPNQGLHALLLADTPHAGRAMARLYARHTQAALAGFVLPPLAPVPPVPRLRVACAVSHPC
jgi:hypothetical protein